MMKIKALCAALLCGWVLVSAGCNGAHERDELKADTGTLPPMAAEPKLNK